MERMFIILLNFIFANLSWGASLSVSTLAGAMMQPTSSYYHASYGVEIGTAFFKENLLIKSSYIERPKFESGGYIDQDYGYFGHVGTRLNNNKNHGLLAFIGYGHMQGYIKDTSSEEKQQRAYSIPGPIYSLEYNYRLKSILFGVNHSSFIGWVNKEQVNARVGWPYNFFLVKLTYSYGENG